MSEENVDLWTCLACGGDCFPFDNFCYKCRDNAPEKDLSNQERFLRHLDNCKLQDRGKCPNECEEGKHLFSRAQNTKFRHWAKTNGYEIPATGN